MCLGPTESVFGSRDADITEPPAVVDRRGQQKPVVHTKGILADSRRRYYRTVGYSSRGQLGDSVRGRDSTVQRQTATDNTGQDPKVPDHTTGRGH